MDDEEERIKDLWTKMRKRRGYSSENVKKEIDRKRGEGRKSGEDNERVEVDGNKIN